VPITIGMVTPASMHAIARPNRRNKHVIAFRAYLPNVRNIR
jgi:hypothetical protein